MTCIIPPMGEQLVESFRGRRRMVIKLILRNISCVFTSRFRFKIGNGPIYSVIRFTQEIRRCHGALSRLILYATFDCGGWL